MWPLASALLSAYLLGSIPTAYLVVRRVKRIDIRTVGSGNAGATNVARVAGLRAGLVVFLVDVAKGLAASGVVARWWVAPADAALRLGCGLSAVIGHSFPVFLQFRGGKGVATAIGAILGGAPGLAGPCLLVWVVVFLLWRTVSVASLAAAVALPVAQLLIHRPPSETWLGGALALVILGRHHENIRRLWQGREPRMALGQRSGK